MILREGRLQIRLPQGVLGSKFDDNRTHGLSHTMKAVDFIIEARGSYWFIELKDPSVPTAPSEWKETYERDLIKDRLDRDLVQKYRDSWLYMWACGSQVSVSECCYYVIVNLDSLDSALLLTRSEALRRRLPIDHPKGTWSRRFVTDAGVFNLESWNNRFPQFPLTIV